MCEHTEIRWRKAVRNGKPVWVERCLGCWWEGKVEPRDPDEAELKKLNEGKGLEDTL